MSVLSGSWSRPGLEYYSPAGRTPFPASAARTVEGPLAVGGKNIWCRREKDSLPGPAPGEQAPRRIPWETGSCPRQVEPGGGRGAAARRYSPPGGTRRQEGSPLLVKTGELRSRANPGDAAISSPPWYEPMGQCECSKIRPLEVPRLSLPGTQRGRGTSASYPTGKRQARPPEASLPTPTAGSGQKTSVPPRSDPEPRPGYYPPWPRPWEHT